MLKHCVLPSESLLIRCLSLGGLLALVAFFVWACERNHPPLISTISCFPESRSAGTQFTLKAMASDEDNDALYYSWSANGGSFTDSTNLGQTSWRSPVDGNGKTFNVAVTVSDGQAEATLDYPISLTDPVFGKVSGYAWFSNCTVPVPGAIITLDEKSTMADSSGYYRLQDIPVGTYTLTATKDNFSTASRSVNILQWADLKVNLPMASVYYTTKVSGTVRNQDGLPIADARVTMLNPDQSESDLTTLTNSTGFYRLWYVPAGQRKIVVRKAQTEDFGFDEVLLDLQVSGTEYPLNPEMHQYRLNGKFQDSRDQHEYGYKIMGTQTWMTGNLAFLPAVYQSTEGSDLVSRYYVYNYEGKGISEAKSTENYSVYGVLYNWKAAQGACPQGWHLPSDTEWKIFEAYMGADAGFRMKSTFGWTNHGNGTNSSGFNVVPAGACGAATGFLGLGEYATFWSTTTGYMSTAWTRFLSSGDNLIHRSTGLLNSGYSVRCLKD